MHSAALRFKTKFFSKNGHCNTDSTTTAIFFFFYAYYFMTDVTI